MQPDEETPQAYTARFEGGPADGEELQLMGWPPLEDYMMPVRSEADGRASAQRYVRKDITRGDQRAPVVHYRPA